MKIIKIQVRTTNKYSSKTKVHFFPSGENLLENLQNRRSRPYTEYRKKLLPQVVDILKELHDINLTNSKFNWSQKAGCSCGCSPAFLVSNSYGYEIYVDFTEN